MVKSAAPREPSAANGSGRLCRGFLSNAQCAAALCGRAADRAAPTARAPPPLTCDQSHFDEIEQILRATLSEAWTKL